MLHECISRPSLSEFTVNQRQRVQKVELSLSDRDILETWVIHIPRHQRFSRRISCRRRFLITSCSPSSQSVIANWYNYVCVRSRSPLLTIYPLPFPLAPPLRPCAERQKLGPPASQLTNCCNKSFLVVCSLPQILVAMLASKHRPCSLSKLANRNRN